MKRLYIFVILSWLSLYVANAQNSTKEVHLDKAGQLSQQLTAQEIKSLERITITGKINEADIDLLRSMASIGKLADIDLAGAQFSKTEDPILSDLSQYFLPMIAGLGKGNEDKMEAYEASLGHAKDPSSLPGFWIFNTGKELFFKTGYLNGWENTLDEVVLKSERVDLLRSPQIRQWINDLGYKFVRTRLNGDIVYRNEKTKIWCLLHFYPFNKHDYPGIHFSVTEYEFE